MKNEEVTLYDSLVPLYIHYTIPYMQKMIYYQNYYRYFHHELDIFLMILILHK